jgi:hypothetical protein
MTRARCFVSLSLVLVACGGTDASQFGNGDPNGGGGAGGDGNQFSTDPVGTNAACVTDMKSASLPAVNLVIMYDKSGSMGNPAEGGDPNLKWIPVNAGMKAFFSDAKSFGYNASLQFFPAPGGISQTCGADYTDPLVPLTPLASNKPLESALDGASPAGGTPTLPALEGAIAYAKKTIAARPDEKTVVVLVTDGEPGMMVNGSMAPGCSNNDIAHVAQAANDAFTASPSIPTYVIGVGQQLTALETIAQQGGTKSAFMVSVSDPTQTRTQLQAAFDAIRSQQKVSCDFAIPAAPKGEQLDKDRVNVGYTNGAGSETPLVYSKDCTAQNGWRYDDPTNPSRIELCPSSCGVAQADPNGKLTIAFGCKTNVAVQ